MNLQTLERFLVTDCNWSNNENVGGGLDELNCPNNLKGELELTLDSDFEYRWANDKLIIPEEFRDLPSLEFIYFGLCDQLRELPAWIDTLTSLKELFINQCKKLKSLPKQMENLSNLELLQIRGCPILKEICQKSTGEDWPLIQHVPFVHFID
ncbi:hypothetical protein Cgig2_007966 [Carnegiea gigantea]|uniref:Disease resistance protein n=1 Tax=Carnegiea gigantea TaxID=171969 RepID=A0A9Q1KFY7_9CARY|nr:hypothetical protein Cgig2_007966 [Carnegiea gigantea]